MARCSRRPARLLVPLATAVVLALSAPAAQGGVLVASATSCDAQALEQPFRRWLDNASYTLVPNGTLEAGSNRWTLSGASPADGNETFYVHSTSDRRSLRIPPGASATTGSICVGLDHPTIRFFATSKAGSLVGSVVSTLTVEVLFEDSLGRVGALPIGVVTPSAKWQPTLPLPVVASLLPLLPNERTAVAFRFRSAGGSEWRIDDVYVDPKSRR